MKRRDLLAAAALFGVPLPRTFAAAKLPEPGLFERDPEQYWLRIRKEQFLLPEWRVFLNNGSLGVACKPVLETVAAGMQEAAARTRDEYPRWGYETLDAHREEAAGFLGCRKDELALIHNATEAMSTVAAGLELKAGDEVLITDQEHPSGRAGWQVRQARHGVSLREVKLPLPPRDPAQLAETLVSALGPRTRVLSFSGIISGAGIVLPVREICDAARAKGVITVVDGAHMHGQMPVRIADLGCDFMAGSPHKWMFAPPGCGFLYIREEMQDRLWPSIVTGGWDNRELKAARFMMMGTNNRALFDGLIGGIRFLREIGEQRVYDRIHQLARQAFDRARRLPYLQMLTPDDDRMFAGMVSFQLDPAHYRRLQALCHQRRIWIVASARLRLSTHIHTRPADLDRFFEALEETRA